MSETGLSAFKQSESAETSLVALARESGDHESTEADEVDLAAEINRLINEHERVTAVGQFARSLDIGILTDGLLDASQKFGTAKVLEALKQAAQSDSNTMLNEAYTILVPDRDERRAFIDEFSQPESLEQAARRMNEIGGTQDHSWHLYSQFERAQQLDVRSLKSKKQVQQGPQHTMTYFDRSGEEGEGTRNVVFHEPELLVPHDGDGDIVDYLNDLRQSYTERAEAYTASHDAAMNRIATEIAQKQAEVQSLKEVIDDIIARDIQAIEAALEDADTEAKRVALNDLLSARQTEIIEKRQVYNSQLESIRDEVIAKYGPAYVVMLKLTAPLTQPVLNDR